MYKVFYLLFLIALFSCEKPDIVYVRAKKQGIVINPGRRDSIPNKKADSLYYDAKCGCLIVIGN